MAAEAKKTIKLKPLTPEGEANNEETINMDKSELDDGEVTMKASKEDILGAEVPGAKQTIKLRPSSASLGAKADAPADKKSAAQTIKLTPSSPAADDGSDDQTVALQKQTVKLSPAKPGDAIKASDPTIKKDSVKPSDPTVKTKLSMKKTEVAQESTTAANAPAPAPVVEEATSDEPGPAFLLAGVIALGSAAAAVFIMFSVAQTL
jgi:hypothetical protein